MAASVVAPVAIPSSMMIATLPLSSHPIAEIALAPSLDLGKLLVADDVKFLGGDAANLDHVGIANDTRRFAIGDGTHGQFRLDGHADLAHQQKVKRSIQGLGRFGRNRHSSAREREHNRITIPVFEQRLGKPPAGVYSILEQHGGDLNVFEDYRHERGRLLIRIKQLVVLTRVETH